MLRRMSSLRWPSAGAAACMADLVGLLRATVRIATLAPASWYRVHDAALEGTSFNPSPRSNARFNTLERSDGTVVPVLYAADTVEGALMETVFHEAPTPSAGAHLRRSEIADKGLVLSEIRTTTELQVIDLTSTGLRRVGLARPQVIDTDATAYPATRALAQHLYSNCPSAHGIQWMSRQLDRSRAVMLFADRLLAGSIALAAPSRSVLDSDVEERILDLAEALGMRFLG